GSLEDRVQLDDAWHLQVAQQREDVASGRPAVDAELVLHAGHLGIAEVDEIRGATVGVDVLFRDLEPYFGRIIIAGRIVVHGNDQAFRIRKLAGDRVTDVMRERGNATFAGEVVANQGELMDG